MKKFNSDLNNFIKITGKYNYYVDIQVKGQTPFQNLTVSITAYGNKNK